MITAIMDINAWSHSHCRLKLNAQKSEVIWLRICQQLAKLNQADMTIHLPDGALTAKPTVPNLGVQLDSELSFDAQARNCVKSCYFITYDASTRLSVTLTKNVCAVRSLRHVLIIVTVCMLIVISTRQRLQRVQNRAAPCTFRS